MPHGMPAYSTLLFDLDHTLLDSDGSEALAFHHTLAHHGVDDPSLHIAAYQRINRALWLQVERQEMSPLALRSARFVQLVEAIGLDVDPHRLADFYVTALGDHGELYAGALDVVAQLAEHATLALVTNGLSEVQRRRLTRLGLDRHFTAVVISAEVNAAKPAPAIFDHAVRQLAAAGHVVDKARTLMIGDNLVADIGGGRGFGVATCWYNPHKKGRGDNDVVTHEIERLDELVQILGI